MNISIVLDENHRQYGKAHKTGCRDITKTDQESLGDIATYAQLAQAIVDATGWDRNEDEARADCAPCVRLEA
ncbi:MULTISPECIES: hypothetical protein [Mycobacteroides]|uniref:Uncharacterized protein n=1 Tax=Mycobacteroides immunogenum TaxID=83262 RepID=A0A179VIR3_9MYCO|nr:MULTISPECIES: hypothetical protein [Mycobacteroides]OAT70943.1 hypothetical protein AWB85_06630 [Mycobacteroides immunogenum]